MQRRASDSIDLVLGYGLEAIFLLDLRCEICLRGCRQTLFMYFMPADHALTPDCTVICELLCSMFPMFIIFLQPFHLESACLSRTVK